MAFRVKGIFKRVLSVFRRSTAPSVKPTSAGSATLNQPRAKTTPTVLPTKAPVAKERVPVRGPRKAAKKPLQLKHPVHKTKEHERVEPTPEAPPRDEWDAEWVPAFAAYMNTRRRKRRRVVVAPVVEPLYLHDRQGALIYTRAETAIQMRTF